MSSGADVPCCSISNCTGWILPLGFAILFLHDCLGHRRRVLCLCCQWFFFWSYRSFLSHWGHTPILLILHNYFWFVCVLLRGNNGTCPLCYPFTLGKGFAVYYVPFQDCRFVDSAGSGEVAKSSAPPTLVRQT